jgi:antirestriction protein ArdC
MKLLADDKRAFLTAAAQAEGAVDWLLAKSPAPAIDKGIDKGEDHVAA